MSTFTLNVVDDISDNLFITNINNHLYENFFVGTSFLKFFLDGTSLTDLIVPGIRMTKFMEEAETMLSSFLMVRIGLKVMKEMIFL